MFRPSRAQKKRKLGREKKQIHPMTDCKQNLAPGPRYVRLIRHTQSARSREQFHAKRPGQSKGEHRLRAFSPLFSAFFLWPQSERKRESERCQLCADERQYDELSGFRAALPPRHDIYGRARHCCALYSVIVLGHWEAAPAGIVIPVATPQSGPARVLTILPH